jgi:hypothetical protein
MFKRFLALTVIVAAGATAVAGSAGANSIPTTGSRIALFAPPSSYPADTPFYVEQGFVCSLGTGASACANAASSFVLSVDGVPQPSRKDVDIVYSDGAAFLRVLYLTNFPQGLSAGEHTLAGVLTFDGSGTSTVSATVTFT